MDQINKRIAFNRVGRLPAPEGLPEPQIYLLWREQPGTVTMTAAEGTDPKWPPTYSFTPMGKSWTDWTADGWEDCEVGTGTFRATGPDGNRYQWEVHFCHDGPPQMEFWGAVFEPPTKL